MLIGMQLFIHTVLPEHVTQLLRVIEDLEGRSRITEDELRSRLTDHYGAEDIRFGWEDLIPFFVEMADEEQ